jgi:GAF domain-containing protein
MEPVPETSEAIRQMHDYGDTDLAVELMRIGEQVQQVVPEVVGVSLGLPAEGFTFTLVASNVVALEMDAVQYLDDGPCVDAIHGGATIETSTEELLDEGRWQLFARALAVSGIESTLSLPILRDGRVVVGVNLYASSAEAFSGHHEELAAICRAWAPGAVANADLDFSTRAEAAATPQRMRDRSHVDLAIGMLAQTRGIDTAAAERRIRDAAGRAGISESRAAQVLIRILSTE